MSCCSIEGCVKKVKSRSWCNTHYTCFVRTGDPIPRLKAHRQGCLVQGCVEKHRRNGYCNMHSARVKRHNDFHAIYPNKMTPEERKENLKRSQRSYDQTPEGKAAAVLKRHRRRHKEGGEVTLTVRDVLAIKTKFGFQCFKCKTKTDLTLDHHLPLALGGKLCVQNCVLLCRRCNGLKADLDPQSWYSETELAALLDLLSV